MNLEFRRSGGRHLIVARLAPSAPRWSRWQDYCNGNPIRPIPWIPRNPLSCHPTPAAIVNTHRMPHTPTMSLLIPIAGMAISPAVPLLQKHGILSDTRITGKNWTWFLTSQRRSQKRKAELNPGGGGDRHCEEVMPKHSSQCGEQTWTSGNW